MKNIFFDLLNGLTPTEVFFIGMQLFAAMLIGHSIRLVTKFSKKEFIPSTSISILVPIAVCFLVIISKNSAPLSIAVLGIFMLTGKLQQKQDSTEFSVIFLLGLVGFGCGSGFVLLTLVFFAIIVLPILYFFK